MHPGCEIEQVYLCREPIDFRKSINGLSVLVEQELALNPFGSALYVFINRQRNKLKVLYLRIPDQPGQ
jgi:transposase